MEYLSESDPVVQALQGKLEAKGILPMYGGRKGHGFWLYRASPEAIVRVHETGGYTHLDDVVIIENDGKRSGNPSFHMWADAVALAEEETT